MSADVDVISLVYLGQDQRAPGVSLTRVPPPLSVSSTQEGVFVDGLPPVVAVKPLLTRLLADDLHLDLLQLVWSPALSVLGPAPPYHCRLVPHVAGVSLGQANLTVSLLSQKLLY